MEPPATPTPPASVTTPTDPPRRWDWRPKLRWFAAEIVVVVAGILIALALNAWWQGRQDASSEQNYLGLVSRDLIQMTTNLEELQAFEAQQLQDGMQIYRLLSAPDRTEEQRAEVSQLVSHLAQRRTMTVVDAAYEDLVSTGNLRLIRNLELRDQIVTFYEEAGRWVEIHNQNNWLFVDGMFTRELIGQGRFLTRSGSNLGSLDEHQAAIFAELADGYIQEPDAVWKIPEGSSDWDQIKGQLLLRIDTASGARSRAGALLEHTRTLREQVEAERNR